MQLDRPPGGTGEALWGDSVLASFPASEYVLVTQLVSKWSKPALLQWQRGWEITSLPLNDLLKMYKLNLLYFAITNTWLEFRDFVIILTLFLIIYNRAIVYLCINSPLVLSFISDISYYNNLVFLWTFSLMISADSGVNQQGSNWLLCFW